MAADEAQRPLKEEKQLMMAAMDIGYSQGLTLTLTSVSQGLTLISVTRRDSH